MTTRLNSCRMRIQTQVKYIATGELLLKGKEVILETDERVKRAEKKVAEVELFQRLCGC